MRRDQRTQVTAFAVSDWRAAKRRLNGLRQFTIDIDGRLVHYVHVKGVDHDSAPLVLTHG